MPAFGSIYSDAEVAAVANSVTARFGAKGAQLTEQDVANLCFGGMQRNRLYICGSTSLYAVYTSAQGAMKP